MREYVAGKRGERAQGLIEFALMAPILMMLFLGTVDYGRFLYYSVAINNAARLGVETAVNHCYERYDCGRAEARNGRAERHGQLIVRTSSMAVHGPNEPFHNGPNGLVTSRSFDLCARFATDRGR